MYQESGRERTRELWPKVILIFTDYQGRLRFNLPTTNSYIVQDYFLGLPSSCSAFLLIEITHFLVKVRALLKSYFADQTLVAEKFKKKKIGMRFCIEQKGITIFLARPAHNSQALVLRASCQATRCQNLRNLDIGRPKSLGFLTSNGLI